MLVGFYLSIFWGAIARSSFSPSEGCRHEIAMLKCAIPHEIRNCHHIKIEDLHILDIPVYPNISYTIYIYYPILYIYYTILYYILLYSIIFYYILLYSIIFYYIISYYIIFYYNSIIFYYILLYYITLYYMFICFIVFNYYSLYIYIHIMCIYIYNIYNICIPCFLGESPKLPIGQFPWPFVPMAQAAQGIAFRPGTSLQRLGGDGDRQGE